MGCVAVLENPQRPLAAPLRAGWIDRVCRERCYGQLNSAADEDVAVDESGFLQIPWPDEDGSDLGVDVLLATATNPTIVRGRYPTGEQVADAWNSPSGKTTSTTSSKIESIGSRRSRMRSSKPE